MEGLIFRDTLTTLQTRWLDRMQQSCLYQIST